ncbi:response regulator transcription factor [uncultured Parabacteroides sp.]|uniref:response regulator transcription factor n=1 Tax=uncultured Parabacteroides sp. TaxID=512312 RepID=UPI00258A4299|nr:response regulator transcription factor [uncultured Parabacteroides sp.]
MRTFIIADNQDITKAGILYLTDKMPEIGLATEAADKKELLQLLIRYPEAIVLLDYTLFDLNGAEELIILQARFRKVSWILFSDELSEDFIRRIVFSSEAFNILLKDSSLEEISGGILSAFHSQQFLCSRIRSLLSDKQVVYEQKVHPILTSTEREVLKAIALGKTTKEIAAERFSSIHTIATHRKNIFRKLEVNNIHEATRYALRSGIIDSAEYYI